MSEKFEVSAKSTQKDVLVAIYEVLNIIVSKLDKLILVMDITKNKEPEKKQNPSDIISAFTKSGGISF